MTVIAFPLSETRDQRLRGIAACLDYLRTEATNLDQPLLAHLIGVAREETRHNLKITARERP